MWDYLEQENEDANAYMMNENSYSFLGVRTFKYTDFKFFDTNHKASKNELKSIMYEYLMLYLKQDITFGHYSEMFIF